MTEIYYLSFYYSSLINLCALICIFLQFLTLVIHFIDKMHKEMNTIRFYYDLINYITITMGITLMNKSLISLALLLVSSTVFAETQYPENPVLRPLTLTDGTVTVSGALAWVEENDENRGELNLNAAYGLTDNLTIELGNVNYRVLARPDNNTGLELAVGLGLRGYQYSKLNGDSVAYGVDLNGKYVFDKDIAMFFSLGYVMWDEEKLKNKDEYRYSVGVQTNVAKNWTATASYTYRDLNDFNQKNAHEVTIGASYAYSKNTDFGMFTGYSSFDAQENEYQRDNSFDRVAGIYAEYRF
jgi:opacity protein-like surface antigen